MSKIILFFKTCKKEGTKKAIIRAMADLMGIKILGFYEKNKNKEKIIYKYKIPKESVQAPALINEAIKHGMFYEPDKILELINTCVAETLMNYGQFLNETGTDVYENRKKIFEYALQVDQNQKYMEHLAKNIFNQWEWEGPSLNMLERCEQVLNTNDVAKQIRKKIYLIYISSLLELKNQTKAQEILEEYISEYEKQDIHLFYPVALLADKLEVGNEKIHKAAIVCKVIFQNENLLETYIAGKNVAIVGSGPYELGKNKGKEIDHHDVVIRFNDYRTKGFERDYGIKTTVWVRNIDTENGGCKDRLNDINGFDLIVLETNIWRFSIPEIFLETFYQYAVKEPQKLYMLKRRDEMIKDMGCFPTSGGLTLYNILMEDSKTIDVYGFSGINNTDISDKKMKHYQDKEDLYKKSNLHHNVIVENSYLNNMYMSWKKTEENKNT